MNHIDCPRCRQLGIIDLHVAMASRLRQIHLPTALELYRQLGNWRLVAERLEQTTGHRFQPASLSSAVWRHDKRMPRWERAPRYDRRFAWGDDFAGDAWRDRLTGVVRYVSIGASLDDAG